MNCAFPFDGEHSLSGGAIFQSELSDDPTEICHLDVSDRRRRLTQEQQEGVEPGGGGGQCIIVPRTVCVCARAHADVSPVDDSPVDDLQDDDPLRAVLQEVR